MGNFAKPIITWEKSSWWGIVLTDRGRCIHCGQHQFPRQGTPELYRSWYNHNHLSIHSCFPNILASGLLSWTGFSKHHEAAYCQIHGAVSTLLPLWVHWISLFRLPFLTTHCQHPRHSEGTSFVIFSPPFLKNPTGQSFQASNCEVSSHPYFVIPGSDLSSCWAFSVSGHFRSCFYIEFLEMDF